MSRPRIVRARPPRVAALVALSVLAAAGGTLPARADTAVARAAAPATPQRPTFTNDAAIAPPGTFELEAGLTASDGTWALPATLRWTPGWRFERAAEFFVSADLVVSESVRGERTTEPGDPLTVGARVPLGTAGGIDWAVQPFVALYHGGRAPESGARGGVNGIAAWSRGRHGLALNVAVSGAVDERAGIPAHQVDAASDWGFAAGSTGTWSVFAGVLRSDASSADAEVAAAAGAAWRLRPWLVLDAAVQRTGLADGPEATVWLVGTTVNLGGPARR